MIKYLFSAILFITIQFQEVYSQHKNFISDRQYFDNTYKIFLETYKQFLGNIKLSFDKRSDISNEEKEALIFLYAYMPLSDWADYDEDFYIKNIKASFEARKEMVWVKNIPEQIYRHFVLPIRVNNENLDTSRLVFYNELKERVKNLSMYNAALEVNHWCHEKVTYRGSDARTSSPLCTMIKAIGRCGEESTFTVAAMRAVGIPARQCYTPRWAHSDDNHAWVEVWIDGKWYFLGACEPEPELNLGWFAAPVKRAMLVNTTIFGDYSGKEEILEKGKKFTKINLLENYAPVKTIFIKTTNSKNIPLNDITVEFQLYNYAEFYPIAVKKTNSFGITNFTTGYGDLLIWAYDKNGSYNFKKINVENTDTLLLIIDKNTNFDDNYVFDINPPIARDVEVKVSEEQRELNNKRLSYEDSLRKEYEKSFSNEKSYKDFALQYNYPNEKTIEILQKSRGNWSEIKKFIETTSNDKKDLAILILEAIAEKDLHDINSSTLLDHLLNSKFDNNLDTLTNINFIFNPRVEYEMIKPYKKELQIFLKNNKIANANDIFLWIKNNIRINNIDNYSRTPISPIACTKVKMCDYRSRNIFFVAACRSLGIASRLEPSTKVPQYYSWQGWKNVSFDEISNVSQMAKSELLIENSEKNGKIKPEYSKHFTIQKFEKGKFHTLDYEMDNRWDNYPVSLNIECGKYLLVTGNRMPDGSVLCNLRFFKIEPNKTKSIQIELRKEPSTNKVLGNLSMNSKFKTLIDNRKITLGDIAKDKPCLLFWIEPGKEPTRHVLVDIEKIKSRLEKWDGKIIIVIQSEMVSRYDLNTKNIFPDNSIVVIDEDKILNKSIKKSIDGKIDFPVVIYSKENGDIIFLSEGYRIGIGEQLIKIL